MDKQISALNFILAHNRSDDEDPLRSFDFLVEVDGFAPSRFQKVTVPGTKISVIEYREGGDQRSKRKLPGLASVDDTTLERGVVLDRQGREDMANWFSDSYDASLKSSTATKNFRREVRIYALDREGNAVKLYTLSESWCSAYQPGGPFDATGDGISVESVTIVCESITVKWLV